MIAKPSRKTTLADVAALAGVSKTAVSAVLNDRCGLTAKVGEKTAEVVRRAAAKLGYRTNLTARSLVTGRTGHIGFMLASSVSAGFKNPYFAGYLQGAETACRQCGYGLTITCAPISEAGQFIHSNILSQRRIDALIVAGEVDTEVYKELTTSGIPYLVINAVPAKGIPTLGAIRQPEIIKFAAAMGHRRIMMTENGGAGHLGAVLRKRIRCEAAKAGVQAELVLPAPGQHPNWETGFGLGRHLFERWSAKPAAERATLIFSNGVLAEFYGELLQAGLKCPEDVSLLGDNTLDTCAFPVFTRLRADHEQVAADAVALLVKTVETGIPINLDACARKVYPATFIEGQTVKQWHLPTNTKGGGS